MAMVFCRSCAKELHDSAPTCVQCGAVQSHQSKTATAIPDGVRGWSWGAFLLSWIWAIGNRTWIGLLALVPYVGFGVAIWLGIQGREMAWKNGSWDNLDHFNRVQRSWSKWGIGLFCGSIVVMTLVLTGAIAVALSGTRNSVQIPAQDEQAVTAGVVAPAQDKGEPPTMTEL